MVCMIPSRCMVKAMSVKASPAASNAAKHSTATVRPRPPSRMYISNPRFVSTHNTLHVTSSPSAASMGVSSHGDEGGGAASGKAIATVGDDSTTTPSTSEADSAVAPNVDNSELCTADAVVAAGTAMVAVMSTLAATTLISTSSSPTPAAVATVCRKLEVSE
eukprot:scaffold93408_cov67-Phaeocystis_antarctica.AAC.1